MNLADLSIALRAYAALEHGKRSRMHFEITRELFRDPAGLANEIADCLRGAAMNAARENPESTRKLFKSLDL